ncbi:MAG: hypothetical protein ACI9O4_002287 [Chitinophagales bacterium]|jgi:hypothetical protein
MELYADDAVLVPAFSNKTRKGIKELETFYKNIFEKMRSKSPCIKLLYKK